MTITIIDAPSLVQTRTSETWWLDARNKSGGVSISGREQVIASPSAVWRATISLPIVNEDQGGPKQWRALMARLRGRARGLRMYPAVGGLEDLYDRLGATAPDLNGTGTLHSDDASFSDDVGYAEPEANLTADAAASAGAVTLDVDMVPFDEGLIDGDWLGIGGHLHIVTTAVANGDGTMTLGFEPPLRDGVTAGATISLNPTVVMRLVSDDQGQAERVGGTPLSQPSIELVEMPEQV